jgi:hypothetical protein
MKTRRLLPALIAIGAVAIAGSIVLAAHFARGRTTPTAKTARAPRAHIAIHSAADARAAFRRGTFAAEVGLTRKDIARTRELYRFPPATRNFTAGLSAYRTPLGRHGFCISFAAGATCTHKPPTTAEPLMGIGLDPDAVHGGEPFVVISVTAPGVRSVTYTCAGTTYPATLSHGVAVFVSPSSRMAAGDCTGNATFASGAVVSRRV